LSAESLFRTFSPPASVYIKLGNHWRKFIKFDIRKFYEDISSLYYFISHRTINKNIPNKKKPYTFLCLSLAYIRALTDPHKDSKKFVLQPEHHINDRERYNPDFCCAALRKSVLLLFDLLELVANLLRRYR
jgi:hypothetical protein